MPAERIVDRDIAGQACARSPDALIGALAEVQHGVVGRHQLFALGLGPDAIDFRVERGRLRPLHRGVYAVGHRPRGCEARWMAALLAAGPGAVLSHRSAAALWGIRPSASARIEVTVPAPRRLAPRSAFLPRSSSLPADECTVERGVPVTTVARTVLDLGAVLRRPELERVMDRAEAMRLGDMVGLLDLLERHRGRRGVANVAAIVAAGRVGATVTRSEFEDRFLVFLAEEGLPRPQVNVAMEVAGRRIEVDFAWPAERLIVELDGWAWHGARAARERDNARDRRLEALGWHVIRLTWRQLHRERAEVAADLRALLRCRARD